MRLGRVDEVLQMVTSYASVDVMNLVALHFNGEPNLKTDVAVPIDGDYDNLRADNLKWVTRSSLMRDAQSKRWENERKQYEAFITTFDLGKKMELYLKASKIVRRKMVMSLPVEERKRFVEQVGE